jgi:TonB family protein
MFSILAGAALLAAQAEVLPAPETAPAVETSAAWEEAKANSARIKGKPEMVEGSFPALPEAEKALGRHGEVRIQGIVTLEGTITDLRISESSNVPELDRLALDAASAFTFKPATDAEGQAIAVLVTVPFYFNAYVGDDGFATSYRCEQFVRDMDWWRSANPDKPFKEHQLYAALVGMQTIALMQRNDMGGVIAAVRAMPARWDKALQKCRKKPDLLMMKAL